MGTPSLIYQLLFPDTSEKDTVFHMPWWVRIAAWRSSASEGPCPFQLCSRVVLGRNIKQVHTTATRKHWVTTNPVRDLLKAKMMPPRDIAADFVRFWLNLRVRALPDLLHRNQTPLPRHSVLFFLSLCEESTSQWDFQHATMEFLQYLESTVMKLYSLQLNKKRCLIYHCFCIPLPTLC